VLVPRSLTFTNRRGVNHSQRRLWNSVIRERRAWEPRCDHPYDGLPHTGHNDGPPGPTRAHGHDRRAGAEHQPLHDRVTDSANKAMIAGYSGCHVISAQRGQHTETAVAAVAAKIRQGPKEETIHHAPRE